jgi:hypothetical protein
VSWAQARATYARLRLIAVRATLVADKTPVDRYLVQLRTATMTPISDGQTVTFTGQLIGPVTPDSHQHLRRRDIGTDAFGTIVHAKGLRFGTVNYSTGAIVMTFIIPPPAGKRTSSPATTTVPRRHSRRNGWARTLEPICDSKGVAALMKGAFCIQLKF